MRILIVEDDVSVSDLLEAVLAELPVDTDTAANVAEAKALLQKNRYGLVISDCRMPGETGVDLLRWVRTECTETKFGFITGSYVQYKEEIDPLSPDFVMEKPLPIRALLDTTRRTLGLP
jgi:DNA-binding NtrC family response regulator